MPHLKHIDVQVRAAVHKVALGGRFHVARQQKAGRTVIDAEDDRGIIGVTVLSHRAELGHGRAAQLPDCAHGGHFHLQALLLGVLHKVLEAGRGGFRHRAVHMVRREVGQRSGQTAHMVLMGMGTEHILQLFHALILQVGDDHAAVVHVAAIVEHILPVALHQHAEGLTYIEEVHLEAVARKVAGVLRLADGRVREDVCAPARDDRRRITGRKAQSQRRCQSQRRQPLERLSPEPYFFRFVVFHVVFSFC